METKKYISLEILAVKLNLPQKFLKELSTRKQIPALNVGSRLRFNPEAVQQALDNLAAKRSVNA